MRILFSIDFDAGYWPGPLLDKEASAGEVWAGPTRLLEILEVGLGLGGNYESHTFRAAALIPSMRSQVNAFWTRSADIDPLGVCKVLLNWYDTLLLHGWKGQSTNARLQEVGE